MEKKLEEKKVFEKPEIELIEATELYDLYAFANVLEQEGSY